MCALAYHVVFLGTARSTVNFQFQLVSLEFFISSLSALIEDLHLDCFINESVKKLNNLINFKIARAFFLVEAAEVIDNRIKLDLLDKTCNLR